MKRIYVGIQAYQTVLSRILIFLLFMYFLLSMYSKYFYHASLEDNIEIVELSFYDSFNPVQKRKIEIKSDREWESKLVAHINNEKPFYFSQIDCIYNNDGNDCLDLDLSLILHEKDHLNIIIRPRGIILPEIPHEYPFPFIKEQKTLELKESGFTVTTENEELMITRRDSHQVILKLNVKELVFNYALRDLKFSIPSTFIFGDMYKVYNTPGITAQKYSQFPFFIQEVNSNFHLVFFRNQDPSHLTVFESNTDSSKKICHWKATEGIIDLHVFLGDKTLDSVIAKFHKYIGGWILLPFWALGHHESKLGYHSKKNFEELIKLRDASGLPVEAIISDLNVMRDIKFPKDELLWNLTAIKEVLQRNNTKWVLILNPFVPAMNKESSMINNEYIKFALKDENGLVCMGISEDSPVVLMDNSKKVTFINFWMYLLDSVESTLHYEGIYLKYPNHNSTLSNSLVSSCSPKENSSSILGPQSPKCEELFKLNRFSHLYTQSYLFKYLSSTTDHPFLLSEETLVGAGQFSGKYLNIEPTWHGLKLIIPEVIKANIFGIPFSGTSFCGHATEIDDELCLRWYQLASFTPIIYLNHFSNKHYEYAQHPYTMPGNYFESMIKSLELRYSLLKYLYTLFIIQDNYGKTERKIGTVFKPLFSVFPDDANIYNSYVSTQQFMIGTDLMIATVTEAKTNKLRVTFPKGKKWYDLRTMMEIPKDIVVYDIKADLMDHTPHFLAGGGMLLKENARGVSRISDLKNQFEVMLAIEKFEEANPKKEVTKRHSSRIFIDRGTEGQTCLKKSCLFYITVHIEKVKDPPLLIIKINFSGGDGGDFGFTGITILGANEGFEKFDRAYSKNMKIQFTEFRATEEYIVIKIENLIVQAELTLEFMLE